jgi:hypothetical protein
MYFVPHPPLCWVNPASLDALGFKRPTNIGRALLLCRITVSSDVSPSTVPVDAPQEPQWAMRCLGASGRSRDSPFIAAMEVDHLSQREVEKSILVLKKGFA